MEVAMTNIFGSLLVFLLISALCQSQDSKSCSSSDQCGPNSCCVSEDRRAKRFIFHSSSGTCRPERYQGQACHVFLQTDFGNPNMYLNYCPCDEGLVCRGETVETHGGSEIHHNPKCIPKADVKTTTTTAAPTTAQPMVTSS